MAHIRVGQSRRDGSRLVGYNVYRAAEGCDAEYYGFAKSLREARRLAAGGRALPRGLWDTAKAAGHCAGLTAPELESNRREGEEASAWFGRGGYDCAVPVWEGGDLSEEAD